MGVDREELGATLGIVNLDSGEEGHGGGERTAEVVSHRLAADISAQEFHARPEHDLGPGPVLEDGFKERNGVQGGGEVESQNPT